MMQGGRDLIASERGFLCIVLVLTSTVLALVGKIPADQWLEYTKWIAVTLVASKTVTGAVETMVARTIPEARVVPKQEK